MKIIITGGGTGGHIYPALAVARALREKGWEVQYLGSRGGLEGSLVPEEGFDYKEVEAAPLPRKISLKLAGAAIKTLKGLTASYRIIKKFKPDIVFGTGGFVAGPVVLAATMLKVPTLIHEQNVYPGFTNKLLARRVSAVALNFAAAEEYFPKGIRTRFVHTGNPIREAIIKTDRNSGLIKLKLESNRKTLLVFGGSQGAMSINKAMLDVYKYYENSRQIQIIQITGQKNYRKVLDDINEKGIDLEKTRHFKILPYLKEMEYAYAVAELVIYRAGATGIAEITAKGLPAILIPYPFAAENHQEYNARNLEKHGAAEVILDKDLSGSLLIEKIESMINDEEKLARMAASSKEMGNREALDNIVNLILELADL
ncbi:MAG: undecaprenyldiphospho-muramoylpentapeptide beta-N-acetylglucosaminyltransferase [Halanaerobiaceae bacterium]|nr:undecaprenyldiphospho-muramoylpentapeptide beta-N-acetylglucosaminyltransferase [Halanaerobiaceae bacterium]